MCSAPRHSKHHLTGLPAKSRQSAGRDPSFETHHSLPRCMSSLLRASASEFVPGGGSSSAAPGGATAAAGAAPPPPGEAAGQQEEPADEYRDYWDDEYEDYAAADPGYWQEQQQALWAAGDDSTGEQQGLDDIALSPEQALALLRQWHPSQPPALLRQLLDACDHNLQGVLAVLTDIEVEQRVAARAAARTAAASSSSSSSSSANAAASTSTWAARRPGQFSLAAEAFPELHRGAQQPDKAAGTPAGHASSSAVGLWEQQQPGSRGGGSSSWAAVAGKAADAATPAIRSSAQASTSSGVSAAAPPRGRRVGGTRADADAAVPWVTTGDAVSAEYAAARAEARDYARVRNACFHQATLAYLAGDKALAKQLSAKGKAAAQQMWAAHEAASAGIFASRNSALARGSAAIDLHGLHVCEVQALLPERLAALAAKKQASVSVIVGTGHHTKGPPSARVGPAVEALLQRLGYRFREVQPGLLRVELL